MPALKQILVALSVLIGFQFSSASETTSKNGSKVIFVRGGDLITTVDNVSINKENARWVPTGNFEGKWRFRFVFVDDTKTSNREEAKEWFQLFFEIEEKGADLKGKIFLPGDAQREHCKRPESPNGEMNASIEPNNSQKASGQMKMCWDTDFWPEFKIDLESNTGVATYRAPDGSEHKYIFTIEKVDNDVFKQMTGDGPYNL